mgnify:CR=1 FL=1
MGLSVAVAAGGIAFAYNRYVKRPYQPVEAKGLHKVLLNKWYVDEIYGFLFVDGLAKGGGRALGGFDQRVVDGGVNGAGWLTRFSGIVSSWWDTWIVDGAVRLTSFLVKMSSYPVRVIQTGSVQTYALVFVFGVALILVYYRML